MSGKLLIVVSALIYLLPVLFLIQSGRRLFRHLDRHGEAGATNTPPASSPGASPDQYSIAKFNAQRGFRRLAALAFVLFLIYLILRLYSLPKINAGGQERFFTFWIYPFAIGALLALGGLGAAFRALARNAKGGWPIFLIFISFAALFIISIVAVVMLM